MGIKDNIKKVQQIGIKKSFKMIAVKWKKREYYFCKFSSKKTMANVGKVLERKYRRIIIFENHLGFYNIMLQRPQHLLKNMGDDQTLIIYNSYYDIDFKTRSRITKINESVYIMDLYYYREALLQATKELEHKYIMVYSTDTVPVSRIEEYERRNFKIIYEYVDDINPELISPKKIDIIQKRHFNLIQNKNALVVTTASKLYENVKQIATSENVVLITNGAECVKFKPQNPTLDKEYRRWLKEDTIKVGYYGALASWVDYNLLKVLLDNQRIQLILLGVKHDNSLRESRLLERSNVRYFGKKNYDELSGYVDFWDVCIIPFLVNDITKATSPVKLFEYMAMGKPIVTTALPECKKYENVNIAYDAEEFLRIVFECYSSRNDKRLQAELRKCAWENDWSAKAAELKYQLEMWEENER